MSSLYSYTLLPGHDALALETAQRSKADLIVFDFEDMVPVAAKAKARLRLRSWLETEQFNGQAIAVRLNAWQSGPDQIDRTALAGLDLANVLLPKIETVTDIENSRAALEAAGVGTPALHAIIETPQALEDAANVAKTGVASLVLGAFDLAKALNTEPDANAAEILRARRLVGEAAKQAGIAAFDMPFIHLADSAGLEEHLSQAKHLGFTGCCAMNSDQAQRINDAFDA